MLPAHQGFGTDDTVLAGVDLRLEVQAEFVARQRGTQVTFHAHAFTGGGLHVVMKQLRGVTPRVFGAVQRDVGALEQVRRV